MINDGSDDLNFMCQTHAIRDGIVELPIGNTSLPKCKLCPQSGSYALINNGILLIIRVIMILIIIKLSRRSY